MLRFIALQGVLSHENVEHSQYRENVIDRDRSRIEELSQHLDNKQLIMQNNVESQHKHTYSLYIGSLYNLAFPIARFICIVTQVFVEIWMRWSTAFSSAFYRAENIYE